MTWGQPDRVPPEPRGQVQGCGTEVRFALLDGSKTPRRVR